MVGFPSRNELVLATLAGVSGVAGSFAVAGYTPAFVVAPIDALVVWMTPGQVVTFVIENLGDEGHYLHIALSLSLAVGLFGALSLAGRRVAARLRNRVAGGGVAGVLVWTATTLMTGETLLALGPAVPVALFTALGSPGRRTRSLDVSRRRVLGSLAGAIGVVGVAVGVNVLGGDEEDEPLAPAPGAEGVDDVLRAADDRSLDVASDDLHGLVSPIDQFYNVDIAEFDPEIPADQWSMTITGEIASEEVTITFDDLTELPVEHRYVTLRCVGERLNGEKLDTAVWTGTPIAPLLEEVDPDGECGCVMLHGEDDYFVQFPTEVLETGFLAWGMNGKQLPPAHGHPVRILIPGHWGETNVKWLTEIEMLDEEMDGYWEQRGWQGTGTVKTVAKLWDEGITELADGRIELAGHAYAGLRGIGRVEVSTDGGETWVDAELSDPLPAEDVWRQWRHRFDPDGTHEVVVRAVDAEGNLQSREESSPSPSGASGWVRRTVRE